MTMMRICAAVAAALAVGAAGAAQGAEIRIGAIAHDIDGPDAGVHGKEDSGGISLGLVSDPIDGPNWLLSPRFEIGGDLNLGGKTNLAYAGTVHRFHFGGNDQFYGELSLGLATHDGYNEIQNLEAGLSAEEVERRIFLNAHYIEFGSDVLFREALTLGYRFNENWATDIYWEHFSHGKILSSGPNEGLDNVGIRVSRRLGR